MAEQLGWASRDAIQPMPRAPSVLPQRLELPVSPSRQNTVDVPEGRVESRLVVRAKRHLQNGCVVLYDLTSSYLEGRCCELAHHGYSRDGQPGKPQIVFGLLCAADGCPIAVEVFEGNTADPTTLAAQITKLRERFTFDRVVLVGDRGMITAARIEADLAPAGPDWITALRAPAIQALAEDGGPLQLSLFDTRDMAEIVAPGYPGERLPTPPVIVGI